MADISIEIKGLDEMKRAFNKAPRVTQQELDKAIHLSIIKLHFYTPQNFQYFPLSELKNKNSPRTGFLMGNRRGLWEVYGILQGRLEERAPYGIYVHDGTSKMRKRPFFEGAKRQGQKDIDKYFQEALDRINKQITP